jgi:hypothetical protein
MIEAQNDALIIDDVKRIALLSGISDSGHMFQMPFILNAKEYSNYNHEVI